MAKIGETGAESYWEHRVPTDRLFAELGDPQRRLVLTKLLETELDWLALDDILSEEPDPVAARAAMVQVHLPRLADAGFVDWERESEIFGPGPRFDEIEPTIELLAAHQERLPGEWV